MTYYSAVGYDGRTPNEVGAAVVAALNANPELCIFNLNEPAVYSLGVVTSNYFAYNRRCQNGSNADFQVNITAHEGSTMPGSIGPFSNISGGVSITNLTGGSATPSNGTDVLVGDTITTTATGSAKANFSDGSSVTMNPGTSISVAQFTFSPSTPLTNNMMLRIAAGVARFVTGVINGTNGSSFIVQTPTGNAGLRD